MNNKWFRGAILALLIHMSIGSVYAWSLLVEPISKYIGSSQTNVQFAFSLAIFFLGMSAAFGGKLVEKNINLSASISCICFILGLFLTGVSIYNKNLIGIYLSYGCLMGIGLGIGYITPVKTLMLWFKDNKGLATGISVMGFGFASAIISPVISYLNSTDNIYTTLSTLSVIYFIPMIIAIFLLKKPPTWKEEKDVTFSYKETVSNKTFWVIWFIIFLNLWIGFNIHCITNNEYIKYYCSNDSSNSVNNGYI